MSLKTRQKRSKKRVRNVTVRIGEVINFRLVDGDQQVAAKLLVKSGSVIPVFEKEPWNGMYQLESLVRFSPIESIGIALEAIPIQKNMSLIATQ